MANKPDNTRKLSADKIVVLPIAEVRPYEKNPRKNSGAVKYVKESIRQFGFKVPIVIDSNRVIVCGHTRLLAAKSLGMTEVPCIMADDLTDDQIKAFRIADNKVGEFSKWDFDLLDSELEELGDFNMEELGFVESKEEVQDFFIDYSIVVDAENELEAKEIFEKLKKMGLKCRIST